MGLEKESGFIEKLLGIAQEGLFRKKETLEHGSLNRGPSAHVPKALQLGWLCRVIPTLGERVGPMSLKTGH